MKNNLLLLFSFLLTSNLVNAQFVQKRPDRSPTKVEWTNSKSGNPREPLANVPDRTKRHVASLSVWKPLPQFQPELNAPPRWYVLENTDNIEYWSNARTDKIIICLKTGMPEAMLNPIVKKYNLQSTKKNSINPNLLNFFTYDFPGGTKSKMIDLVRDAKRYSFILYAEPNIEFHLNSCIPNDPDYFNVSTNQGQWAPYSVWADSAWCYSTGTSSFPFVGVLDNAVDWIHPDLFDNVWYGADYADLDNDFTPDNAQQTHGTHVTGISSGGINNNIGIAGMANDTVVFGKVTQASANPTSVDMIAATNALLDFINFPRIRVVNMSFGSTSNSATLESACNNAFASGMLLVAAAGNDAVSTPNFPAAYASVISVGSVDISYNLSSFSNFGSDQELTAPGGDGPPADALDILSTMPGNNYGLLAGTSMAAPMVTGLAGLMFARNPNATNTIVRTILQQCVDDMGPAGWDNIFGFGVIRADCATIVVGTNEAPSDGISFNIFPNPGQGIFKIRIPEFKNEADLEVYNSIGELVAKEKLFTEMGEIDLSKHANGMYMVRITSEKQSGTKRLNLVR